MDNSALSTASPKWTEIEHLPEWDEEFYHVYTAKKHGKWLMLKTLRPELKGQEKYEKMIEKEFEVRYNLAHPHIIMINDFEEVPGLGMCIITDDVYGTSLRKAIDEGKLTEEMVRKLSVSLLDAIAYIQQNHIVHHPIRPETVIFTQDINNMKIIDVGFDQHEQLSPADITEDLESYGRILQEALDASGCQSQRLRAVAQKCMNPRPGSRYRDTETVRNALEGRSEKRLFIIIIAFLAVMVAILGWFCWRQPVL